jgi:hypothetical protein
MSTIRPFHIHVPDDALADLRRRVQATRWPDRETVTGASQGIPLESMQALARYWGTDYDWRKAEAKLDALPMFVTNIDGSTSSSSTCARRTRTRCRSS